MRISKIRGIAAVTAAAMLLGGCGAAPYELTETEEGIIVSYAAHVVTKFNTNQTEGLTYVLSTDTAEETQSTEEADLTETSSEEENSAGVQTVADTQVQKEQAASLSDIFGTETTAVAYTGASLQESYMEDTYYAVDADTGNTFLVLHFQVSNSGTEDEELDYLTQSPRFTVELADGTTVVQEMTVLSADFSTYQGTLLAGADEDMILLFQVSDTITETPDFSLSVTVGGVSYQITL